MRAAPAPPAGLLRAAARVAAIKRRFGGLSVEFGEALSRAALASHPGAAAGRWEEGTVRQTIASAARGVGLSADLLLAVAEVESGLRPDAVSPKGALGLMQLMPGTAAALGIADAFDVEENARGGARYLRGLLDRFGGDTGLALAAYNAGPGAVERHGGIPPFAETQRYVARVLARVAAAARDGASPAEGAGGGFDAAGWGGLKSRTDTGDDTGGVISPSTHERDGVSDTRNARTDSGDPARPAPGAGRHSLPDGLARGPSGHERRDHGE